MGETLATDSLGRPYGTCDYCGQECGAKSVICVGCTLSPKRREKAKEGKL